MVVYITVQLIFFCSFLVMIGKFFLLADGAKSSSKKVISLLEAELCNDVI